MIWVGGVIVVVLGLLAFVFCFFSVPQSELNTTVSPETDYATTIAPTMVTLVDNSSTTTPMDDGYRLIIYEEVEEVAKSNITQ